MNEIISPREIAPLFCPFGNGESEKRTPVKNSNIKPGETGSTSASRRILASPSRRFLEKISRYRVWHRLLNEILGLEAAELRTMNEEWVWCRVDGNCVSTFLHSFCSLLEGICNIRETRRILRIVLFDRDWRGVIILSRPIFIRWIMQILLGIFSGAFCKYSNSIFLGRKGETSGDGGKAWWKYVGT